MTKNKLPENWSIKYDESINMHRVYIVLEILDPTRVEPWKEYITRKNSNGDHINYDKCQKTTLSRNAKYPVLSLEEFISLTEEKEEWEPKKGEDILVKQYSESGFNERIFMKMDNGFYECVSAGYEDYFKYGTPPTTKWDLAKPIEQPKEVPFTPTVGHVCLMKSPEGEGNYVFVGKLGSKFMGCSTEEYADLIENYGGLVELFDSVEPVKKIAKRTIESIRTAFNLADDTELEIEGYIKIPSVFNVIGRS